MTFLAENTMQKTVMNMLWSPYFYRVFKVLNKNFGHLRMDD